MTFIVDFCWMSLEDIDDKVLSIEAVVIVDSCETKLEYVVDDLVSVENDLIVDPAKIEFKYFYINKLLSKPFVI